MKRNRISYYTKKLSAFRLKQVYDTNPPRVQQYLEPEANHVLEKIQPKDKIIELGCGYGPVLRRLSEKAGFVIGIDTSHNSLLLGREMLADISRYFLLKTDAIQYGEAFGLLKPEVSYFSPVIPINSGVIDWNGSNTSPMLDYWEKSISTRFTRLYPIHGPIGSRGDEVFK